MIIIKRGKELIKIHDLPKLSKMAEIVFSDDWKMFLEDLNTFYLKPRYPDMLYSPLPKLDKKFTKDYLEKTDKLFIWLQKQ